MPFIHSYLMVIKSSYDDQGPTLIFKYYNNNIPYQQSLFIDFYMILVFIDNLFTGNL